MKTPWTPEELKTEHAHIKQTRLNIMAPDGNPTPRQEQIAQIEADEVVRVLQTTQNREL